MTAPTHTSPDAIEARLRAALDERAALVVPSERAVPPIAWPEPALAQGHGRRTSRRRQWAPLAAAAAVLAVAGSLVTPQLLRPTDVSPGVGAPGSVTTAPATATAGWLPPPSTAPAPAPAPSPGIDPAWRRMDLGGGASVPLPVGWLGLNSREVDAGLPAGQCFGPSAASPCAILVATIDPTDLDPDVVWGRSGDPGVCDSNRALAVTTAKARVATVGGREAEFRRLTVTCAAADIEPSVAQYVVPTLPGWVIATRLPDDPDVGSVFARMVGGLTLPASRAPLRLVDHGRIASVSPSGNGVDLVLKRMSGAHVNSWRETGAQATYHVPAELLAAGQVSITPVGQLITIRTDGSTVTSVVFPGG